MIELYNKLKTHSLHIQPLRHNRVRDSHTCLGIISHNTMGHKSRYSSVHMYQASILILNF